MTKKKKNPSVNLRQNQVNKIKTDCTNDAIKASLVLCLTVLHNKEGYEQKDLVRIFGQINELAETVTEGYITIEQLRQDLIREVGIHIDMGSNDRTLMKHIKI